MPERVTIKYDGSKQKVSPSLIIKPVGPVPYSSEKAIPFRYNAVAVEDGKKVLLSSSSVVLKTRDRYGQSTYISNINNRGGWQRHLFPIFYNNSFVTEGNCFFR